MATAGGAAALWPAGSSDMAQRIRSWAWAGSPLGPAAGWPDNLRQAIELMLPAQAKIVLFWGPQHIAFYNDAYAAVLGDTHPQALGQACADVGCSAWSQLAPMLTSVWTTGLTFSAKDQQLKIKLNGVVDDRYFDVSCSALRDSHGAVAGLMGIFSETTERVGALRALRATTAQLQLQQSLSHTLLHASAEGAYAVDHSGAVTLCNSAFLSLLGYDTAAEVVGRKLHHIIDYAHTDTDTDTDTEGLAKPAHECPVFLAARDGTAAAVAGAIFLKKDGSPLPVDYRARPIWHNGVLQGAVCVFADISERAAAESLARSVAITELALRESLEQLRLAQVAGGVGLFLLDVKRNTVTGSQEFFRLFGVVPAVDMPVTELDSVFLDVPSDDKALSCTTASSQAARLRGDPPLEREYRIKTADTGELRWLARRAEFVRDADGKPLFMRGVVQDVTDRKAAEATVKASEARFRALVQTLPNQVWIADSHGQLSWFNQVLTDYSGLPAAAMAGDAWTQLIHPDDLPEVAIAWPLSLESLVPYHIEFRIRRHDGAYRWHLSRAVPVESDDGIQWVGTNTDVDDQRARQDGLTAINSQLEQEVNDRTRDLDRMWRLSTDLILLASIDGWIRSVNPAWHTLLGWSDEYLVGSNLRELIHPEDLLKTEQVFADLGVGRIVNRFENRYRRRDGKYCTISWLAVPDGVLMHALGRDVSAEREAAATLIEVEERLRQSQKMEALGQLTGGIAHDFNNLLQGISGAMELVRSRLAAGRIDDVHRFMDSATQSAHRAASLIQRLLAFARRQSLESRPVAVNQLVMSMEDLLRRTLGEHITLKVIAGADVWMARSDENQLESAIVNLAVNARDAMPHGGALTIQTRNVTLQAHDEQAEQAHEGLLPGDYAVVSVTDNGSGMPPAVLARVFEPFFTTKPIGQGTGLGLSGIYGFAKQSGGHVRLQSQPGLGTVVHLYLPRQAGVPVPLQRAHLPQAPQGEGQVVLVVEDDAVVRMIVLDELGELGYRTLEAADGPSALPMLQSDCTIDLLLTDVGLPGMNGRQVAEIARQHRPGLRVLFMTGYAEQAASRSTFLAPGMDIITKPFVMNDLAARIGVIFEDQRNAKGQDEQNNSAHNAQTR